ncbi:glycosyltransferase [Parahaliea aestuarii]|uniref:Glycosyltransferase n=1 Tax=Parahaliea aestuarii TaxID=1852021 RepID=A0A5C8ZRS6_9GAMM|nr:glycosyltransferase [Parahaliea aestuarii]TXS90061.1 glycosyltransferase [Parahaliea aestuarii]
MPKVDIVIPVYRGLEETRSCIESVLATTAGERLVLVNDCSPEPEITQYLRELDAAHDRVLLLENAENLGFVATANRGMAAGPDADVLLLNSDVEVANDWLARLCTAAYSQPKVASVTPFANNATIMSFPNFCEDNELLFGLSLAELDHAFARRPLEGNLWPIPSGVGCCMYLRRDCLEAVGLFDLETFGRGYGEENDWCQRAHAAGWTNYHLGNCFVYHKGGVSFAAEQSPRIAAAMEILDDRYPHYHSTVQRFIGEDPARIARTEVLFDLVASLARPKIVAISHKLGGGAQQHVDELARYYAGDALFLQLTPERSGKSVALSIFSAGERLKDGLQFDIDSEYDELVQLLRELGVGHVHFHHTMGLPPRLWLLAEALDCRHDLTVHDYYLVNGNPTLTDRDARYVDPVDSDFDQRCATHYPLPEGVTASLWRENQQLLIGAARRVIFPSADCARRFCHFYDIETPVVAWHPDYLLSQPYPAPQWSFDGGRPLKVLVVGAISREKGADVIEAVANALAKEGIEFHLLGYAYRALSEQVVTHGPYDNGRVYELVGDIQPDVVWFPALWPETYSYTLSVALHMGLPVVVPQLGAFVERVAGRPLSAVLPWDTTTADWRTFWLAVRDDRAFPGLPQVSSEPPGCAIDLQFYPQTYLSGLTGNAARLSDDTLARFARKLHLGLPQLSRKERVLARIWSLARTPLVAKMVSVVPFRVQRAIKRRLSSRPMHEIIR